MGFSLRKILTFAAVAVTLGVLVVDADARVGGGSSSGSRGSRTFSAPAATKTAPSAAPIQRSATQPNATGVARPGQPATQGGFFNRPGMGLLGGLAAGFLGAGLLGMLFGGGLSGGLGGIASFFGLLLQLGLIAIVAMLVWRWFQNRNQPATAGGPSLRDNLQGMGGQSPTSMGFGGGFGGAAPQEALEIVSSDYDAFERLLADTQAAFSAEDLGKLRGLATPEMVSYFAEQLADNASHGVVNQISSVKLLQGDLAEAWREDGAEYATVAMRFALVDKTVERATGRVVDGGDAAQEVTEIWTFRRPRGGSWMLSAIQQA